MHLWFPHPHLGAGRPAGKVGAPSLFKGSGAVEAAWEGYGKLSFMSTPSFKHMLYYGYQGALSGYFTITNRLLLIVSI